LKKAICIGILLTFMLGFSMIGTTQAATVTYTKIWATPEGVDRGTVYGLWIEDTDNDNKSEIIAGTDYRGGGLLVYETDGDNSFAEVFNMPGPTTWYHVSATNVNSDADKDNKSEIVGGGRLAAAPHYVYVYEWRGVNGVNEYDQVWNYSFDAFVEGAEVTDDLDKDGAREIVVATGLDYTVRVFECTGDNTYTLEWSFDVTTVGAAGIRGMTCGDIDNDGWIEIAVECEAHVLVLNSSTTQATPHLEWGPIILSSPPGAWGAIDVSIEKDGLSQDLDNDGFKEIVVGCEDRVAIYENLAPDSYNSTPAEIRFVNTNRIEVDVAWDLDNNNKNELLCGGGYPGSTYNVSIFEFGSTLDDVTLVWSTNVEDSPNAIRASERFCHYDLDQEITDLTKDKGNWEFVVGLYYTAVEDLQVFESDVLAGHIPEFPTLPLVLVMLLALTTATISIRRRIRH